MANYFHQTLQHLREYEEVLLFAKLSEIDAEMEKEMLVWAEREYNLEKIEYPGKPPSFDAEAALWSGRMIYTAAQLLVFREHSDLDLPKLFPAYNYKVTASAILSADLFLRFLPDIVKCLQEIDYDDQLITILEDHLHVWHYSAVHYQMKPNDFSYTEITSSSCLYMQYIDRIIANRRTDLAQLRVFSTGVNAALGMYADHFWKELNLEIE